MDSFDGQVEALRHVERRRLLVELLDDPPLELPRVTDEVSVRTGDDRSRAVSMIHVHLPKLSALGFIDWKRDHGRVERGPRFDELVPLLSFLLEHSDDHPVDVR